MTLNYSKMSCQVESDLSGVDVQSKYCKKGNHNVPIAGFGTNGIWGLHPTCRACRAKKRREVYHKDLDYYRDDIKHRMRQRYARERETAESSNSESE